MRLTPHHQNVILQIIKAGFGDQSKVWLFGSRVDDTKRGGDVDLYIEPATPNDLMTKLHCKVALQDRLGMPIDLIVKNNGKEKPIYKIAKKEGILL